ncbi:MAG: TadE family protein [bacterium]
MNALPRRRACSRDKRGQALIESCMVIAIICLIFFGIFQISQLFAAQEVLDYAAGRGARAITVGFNRFMVEKTVRVGAIANAGRLVNPAYQGGPAVEHALEAARIPLYLAADNHGQLGAILDYERWDTISFGSASSMGDGTFRFSVGQEVPLTNNPFSRAITADSSIDLSGENYLDEHYTLYMDDAGW